MKILWASKHVPADSQIKELHRIFGSDIIIDVLNKDFFSAKDILCRFKKGSYDEMVVIAPLSVCRQLIEFGYHPLYSEMLSVLKEDADVIVESPHRGKRYYRFVKFKRLEKMEMVFSDLGT